MAVEERVCRALYSMPFSFDSDSTVYQASGLLKIKSLGFIHGQMRTQHIMTEMIVDRWANARSIRVGSIGGVVPCILLLPSKIRCAYY